MSDYQCAEQLLAMLSRLDGDFPKLKLLFPRWELVLCRRQDGLRRHLPLPDEDGDRMEAETITMAEDADRELHEYKNATIRFLKGQGVDTRDFFLGLYKLANDLLEIRGGFPCKYQSRSQLMDMQVLLGDALVGSKPVENSPTSATPPAPRPESSAADDRVSGGNSGPVLSFGSPLSANDYTRLLNNAGYSRATRSTVGKFLRELRKTYVDCYVDHDAVDEGNRRRKDPRYVYHPDKVWTALVEHFSDHHNG